MNPEDAAQRNAHASPNSNGSPGRPAGLFLKNCAMYSSTGSPALPAASTRPERSRSVRNGPGITVSGIHDGSVVHGTVEFMVNAFGAEEPFEPYRAESRTPTPVWVWVLALLIVAWSAWYFAAEWEAPPNYQKTPTYSAPMDPFG